MDKYILLWGSENRIRNITLELWAPYWRIERDYIDIKVKEKLSPEILEWGVLTIKGNKIREKRKANKIRNKISVNWIKKKRKAKTPVVWRWITWVFDQKELIWIISALWLEMM